MSTFRRKLKKKEISTSACFGKCWNIRGNTEAKRRGDEVEEEDNALPNSTSLTEFVNTAEYLIWRSKNFDDDEKANWTSSMLDLLQTASGEETWTTLSIPIQRGVPDVHRRVVWLKSNNADEFSSHHITFYQTILKQTFGTKIPKDSQGKCPTFCGGFLGIREDVEATSIDVADWEIYLDDFDRTMQSFDQTTSIHITDSVEDLLRSWFNTSHGGSSPKLSPNRRNTANNKLSAHPKNNKGLHSMSKDLSSIHNYWLPTSGAGTAGFMSEEAPVMKSRSSLFEMNGSPPYEEDGNEWDDFQSYMALTHNGRLRQGRRMLEARREWTMKLREDSMNESRLRRAGSADVVPRSLDVVVDLSGSAIFSDQPSVGRHKLSWWRRLLSTRSSRWQDPPKVEPPTKIVVPTIESMAATGEGSMEALQRSDEVYFNSGAPSVVDASGGLRREEDMKSDAMSYSSESDMYASDCSSSFPSSVCRDRSSSFFSNRGDLWSLAAEETAAEDACTVDDSALPYKPDVQYLEHVSDFYELLNERGKTSVKCILWCLNALHSQQLEFCPLIPNLCCILLLYMKENETFSAVHCIIKHAVKSSDKNLKRPYLPLTRSDFIRFVKVILEGFHMHLPKLFRRLRNLGVDLAAWVARAVQDGFAKMLPFNYILRIYGTFLFEGCKVFYRYAMAILKFLKVKLMKCQTLDEAEMILYHISSYAALDLSNLTKVAYRLNIHKHHGTLSSMSAASPSPYLLSVKMNHLYHPRVSDMSAILHNAAWEVLWTWLPNSIRIMDPQLSYSSNRDGVSVSAMLRALGSNSFKPILMVIQTIDAANMFGGYFPFILTSKSKYEYDTQFADALLFQLKPTEAAYPWAGNNFVCIQCTNSEIFIGSSDVAIYLDSGLTAGRSCRSASFNSPSFVSNKFGDFTVGNLEVWTFH